MEGFTFYRSYWQTAQAIPDAAQRLAFLEACIAYTLDDEDPEELPAFSNIAFTAVRPSLDRSKARSETGKQKGAATRTESEPKQTEANKSEQKRNEANKSESNTVTDTVTDTVTEKDNVRRAAPVSDAQLAEEFEKLWAMYPKDRRRGKKKAAAAYKRARTRQKKPVAFTDVQLGIARYNGHIAARRIDSNYILQAETYFCNERWSDEYDSGGSSVPSGKWEQGIERNNYTDADFEEFAQLGAG